MENGHTLTVESLEALVQEHRRLNPFADINSFASRVGYMGARPLDCKGELGAGPVQRWKEMLREGDDVRPSRHPCR